MCVDKKGRMLKFLVKKNNEGSREAREEPRVPAKGAEVSSFRKNEVGHFLCGEGPCITSLQLITLNIVVCAT